MTDLRKAAEMALEALERCEYGVISNGRLKNSIEALSQALAQPEQEPVAWITPAEEGFRLRFERPTNDVPLGWEPLYTAPPKREWIGLTDNERADCWSSSALQSAINIETKLKEKNGY